MKIVVLSNEHIKNEIEAKINHSTVELTFADTVNDFSDANADAFFDFSFDKSPERIEILSRHTSKPVFINSVVYTLGEIGHPFIRINAWPGFLKRDVVEIAADDKSVDIAKNFLEKLNWKYQLVPDEPGMISARIIAMIINEAYYTAQENISSKPDIDIAMKLGTNYPYGPFEWANLIGIKNIYSLLTALQKKDKRYTISKLLEAEAAQQPSK